MKRLCVLFCFLISSLLFSSHSQDLNKEWLDTYNQRFDSQLKKSFSYDITIQESVKKKLWQANAIKKDLKLYDDILYAWQKRSLLHKAAVHKDQAFSMHCADLERKIALISSQISKILSVDTSKDRSIQYLLAQFASVPLSIDLDSYAGSISSMTHTSCLESPKSRTSSTTEETISNTSVEFFMPRLKESVQVPKIDPTSGITKFQARYRGNVLREDLSQLQAQAGYEKESQEKNAQKLMQKNLNELQLKKIKDQKKLLLEQQAANLKLRIQKEQEKRKEIEQNIENKKNEDEFVLQQVIQDQILESFSSAQFAMVHGLSSKDKKILKPLQKVIRDELFNFSNIDDKIIVDRLKPIVMNCLKKEGVDHEALSNWIVRSAVQASRDGFNDCVQTCGKSFDGTKVFERIIQPSVGNERFDQLQSLNKDRNLQLSDGQIDTIMKIEKQLLLGSFILRYKNNVLRPYILLTKNNK
jgi:hypothetical protein